MVKKSEKTDNSLIIISLSSLMILFLIFLTNNESNLSGFLYNYENYENIAGQKTQLLPNDRYLTHGKLVELLKEVNIIVKTNNDAHIRHIPQWNCIDACGEKGKNCFYSYLFVEKYLESAQFLYPITCSERLDLDPPNYKLYCGCI